MNLLHLMTLASDLIGRVLAPSAYATQAEEAELAEDQLRDDMRKLGVRDGLLKRGEWTWDADKLGGLHLERDLVLRLQRGPEGWVGWLSRGEWRYSSAADLGDRAGEDLLSAAERWAENSDRTSR
jgi:hypothetical protein